MVVCTQEMTLVLLSVWPREINTSLAEYSSWMKTLPYFKGQSMLGEAHQYGHITSSIDSAYNQEVCIVHVAINHVQVC